MIKLYFIYYLTFCVLKLSSCYLDLLHAFLGYKYKCLSIKELFKINEKKVLKYEFKDNDCSFTCESIKIPHASVITNNCYGIKC